MVLLIWWCLAGPMLDCQEREVPLNFAVSPVGCATVAQHVIVQLQSEYPGRTAERHACVLGLRA